MLCRGAALTTSSSITVESVWRRQGQWSKATSALKRRFEQWRMMGLILLILATICGALVSYPATPPVLANAFAAAGATYLGVASFIQYKVLSAELEERVRATSSVAESLKSEVYRYLARVSPYDNQARDQELVAAYRTIEEQATPFLQDVEQEQPDWRPLPGVADFNDYVEVRVQEQHDWHLAYASRLKEKGARVHRFQILATVAAVFAASLGITLGNEISTEISCASAILAAVAAFLGATQYDKISAKYTESADYLQRLLMRINNDDSATARSYFVSDVERALLDASDSRRYEAYTKSGR